VGAIGDGFAISRRGVTTTYTTKITSITTNEIFCVHTKEGSCSFERSPPPAFRGDCRPYRRTIIERSLEREFAAFTAFKRIFSVLSPSRSISFAFKSLFCFINHFDQQLILTSIYLTHTGEGPSTKSTAQQKTAAASCTRSGLDGSRRSRFLFIAVRKRGLRRGCRYEGVRLAWIMPELIRENIPMRRAFSSH